MIDTEFAKQTSLDAVAQAVVDRVKRIHSDTFASGGERAKFCPRHEDMTLLVRQLAPGPQGLPLEIYAFTNTTAWAAYEAIQADIFDHLSEQHNWADDDVEAIPGKG